MILFTVNNLDNVGKLVIKKKKIYLKEIFTKKSLKKDQHGLNTSY